MTSAETFVNRLADFVAEKAGHKIKVRTLLNGFGYERRSPQVVAEIHRRLKERGLTVELSASLPKTLDERVWVVSSQDDEMLAEEPSVPGPKPPKHAEAII